MCELKRSSFCCALSPGTVVSASVVGAICTVVGGGAVVGPTVVAAVVGPGVVAAVEAPAVVVVAGGQRAVACSVVVGHVNPPWYPDTVSVLPFPHA